MTCLFGLVFPRGHQFRYVGRASALDPIVLGEVTCRAKDVMPEAADIIAALLQRIDSQEQALMHICKSAYDAEKE